MRDSTDSGSEAARCVVKAVTKVTVRNGYGMMIATIAVLVHGASGVAQSAAQTPAQANARSNVRFTARATVQPPNADGEAASALGTDDPDDGRPAAGTASQSENRQTPLLDDIPKVRRRGASKEPAPMPSQAERLDSESGEDLGAKKRSNPLRLIESSMQSVEKAMLRDDLAAGTQSKQREITQQLAALIEQLERQRQASSRSSGKSKSTASEPGPTPSSTGQEVVRSETGTDRPPTGADREGEKVPVGLAKEVWGQLPARVRRAARQPVPGGS